MISWVGYRRPRRIPVESCDRDSYQRIRLPVSDTGRTPIGYRQTHADAVPDVFQSGIDTRNDTGNASLEAAPPDWPTWVAAHLPDHRFVARDGDGQVLDWVAASPTFRRCVDAGVVERASTTGG